jgi:YfiH family protein
MGEVHLGSALLREAGIRHGFSLRTGGVSEGPLRSLNLARTLGDRPDAVAENWRRFTSAVGVEEPVGEVSQVHGARVVQLRGDPVAFRSTEADALFSDDRPVAVRVADCLPLLLADPPAGRVAAVHVGWRGLVAGVVDAALDAFEAPERLLAAIGPHIRRDAFEVGADVARQIAAVAPDRPVVEARDPRPHADLALAVTARLEARGVRAIDDVGGCTFGEPDRFFSHRRDRGATGRHIALIAPPR